MFFFKIWFFYINLILISPLREEFEDLILVLAPLISITSAFDLFQLLLLHSSLLDGLTSRISASSPKVPSLHPLWSVPLKCRPEANCSHQNDTQFDDSFCPPKQLFFIITLFTHFGPGLTDPHHRTTRNDSDVCLPLRRAGLVV